ncbi:hypothetical protein CTI12_AA248110 [Artemisia annua]|uniref:Homologous recombination OB-fold protein OB-fold domain-containing protein n=1 Tax=Artemisia annua TaxID=35608 RepID=A0A2U1NN10_ARTAN|nr:hypothetical protein CTI12_AA248110 [Artemisia annua]
MYNDMTYSFLVEMLVNKFELNPNKHLSLSYRLSPTDSRVEINDDNDVRLFVTCVCESTNSIPHLYIYQHEEITQTMDQTLIIPGPAGILQAAKLRKCRDITEGSSTMPTQDYVKKVIEDASEDDHFSRGPWLSALEYCGAFGIEVDACLGNIEKFIKKGKVELVVAVIKSCSPNILGDLTVTLKDPSGIMSGTIHHKVLDEKKSYAKMIGVGAVLILKNISVFTPKAHHHYLNITLKNMVEVFQNDTVY